MRHLLDTNILLRVGNPDDALHPLVRAAVVRLLAQEHSLHIVPQSLYEFWSVATRPKSGTSNGFGWTPAQANQEVHAALERFPLLPDTPEIFGLWLELVTEYEVSGRPSHDARLVAAMQAHGLTHLLTLNTDDFKRFSSITAVHPSSVSQE